MPIASEHNIRTEINPCLTERNKMRYSKLQMKIFREMRKMLRSSTSNGVKSCETYFVCLNISSISSRLECLTVLILSLVFGQRVKRNDFNSKRILQISFTLSLFFHLNKLLKCARQCLSAINFFAMYFSLTIAKTRNSKQFARLSFCLFAFSSLNYKPMQFLFCEKFHII